VISTTHIFLKDGLSPSAPKTALLQQIFKVKEALIELESVIEDDSS